MFKLDGKVAIVTGGTRGIGLKCAELLAASGAKVAVVSRQPDNVAKAIKIVQKKGIAQGYQLDVANISAIPDTVKRIRQDLGEVDILVCSAGVNLGGSRPAADITEVEWDTMLSVNAKGTFFCNQAVAIQSMIPRETGAIVNISSQAGLIGAANCLPYAASKAAVIQLTRAEAIEWAPYNIRVNSVAPTWTLTDMVKPLLTNDAEFESFALSQIPLHRLATVDDVAHAICFLASDLASMITGVVLPVDGGRTAK